MTIARIGLTGLTLLVLVGFDPVAHAHTAPGSPPTGAWYGQINDERTLILIISGPSATVEVRPKSATIGKSITGPWNWEPNASGGILTILYRNDRYAYTISYVDDHTLNLSNAHIRVTLNRL